MLYLSEYRFAQLYQLFNIVRYGPGSVIILMSGALFHSVTRWTPLPAKDKDDCTPGRIGHVYFFPEKTYKALEGKRKDWFVMTNGGLLTAEESESEGEDLE